MGDCLINAKKPADIKTVDCADSTAKFKVAGKIEGRTADEFSDTAANELCAAYPTAVQALWTGQQGAKGDVLCLEPTKK